MVDNTRNTPAAGMRGNNRMKSSSKSSSSLKNSQQQQRARQEMESQATRKLLSDAEKLLAAVDDSYVFQEQNPRNYPTFERSELITGPLLGVGGFGAVFEVEEIHLKVPIAAAAAEVLSKDDTSQGSNDETETDATDKINDTESEVVDKRNRHTLENFAVAAGSGSRTQQQQSVESSHTTTTIVAFNDDIHRVATTPRVRPTDSKDNDAAAQASEEHYHHYDVKTARNHIAEHVRRNGDARYAVKQLKQDLSDYDRARGMIDLAIEAKFLSVVWHPNIIKMRAVAAGTMLSPQFFIVMDRLYEILPKKMKHWSELARKWGGTLGIIGGNKLKMKQLLVERLVFSYDLAAAFWYMHENKLVYRDVKQENIGFDIRGDIKIFDFGLCKGLSPALKNKDGHGYLLTARTGTVPYMAPEVAECYPYDCKCDVFSFAILLWEMLSLKTAFKGLLPREYVQRIVRCKERPLIKRSWPPMTRLMIQEAWDNDPQKRPDMKRVAALIRGDLNSMTTDLNVRDRTQHMRERSAHSIRLARGLSSLKAASKVEV